MSEHPKDCICHLCLPGSEPRKPCPDEYTIERTSHEVIENKLLVHISKPGNVAILANEQELHDFLDALEWYDSIDRDKVKRCAELADGIRQLLNAAFPK